MGVQPPPSLLRFGPEAPGVLLQLASNQHRRFHWRSELWKKLGRASSWPHSGRPALTKLLVTEDTVQLAASHPQSSRTLTSETIVEFSLEGQREGDDDAVTLLGELRLVSSDSDEGEPPPSVLRFVLRVRELDVKWEWVDLAKRIGAAIGLGFFRVEEHRVEVVRLPPQVVASPFRATASDWQVLGAPSERANYTHARLEPDAFSSSTIDKARLDAVLKEPPSWGRSVSGRHLDLQIDLQTWDLSDRIRSRTPAKAATTATPASVDFWLPGVFASAVTMLALWPTMVFAEESAAVVGVVSFVVAFLLLLSQGAGGVYPARPGSPEVHEKVTTLDMKARRLLVTEGASPTTDAVQQDIAFGDIEVLRFVQYSGSVALQIDTLSGAHGLFNWDLDSASVDEREQLVDLSRGLTRQLAETLGQPIEVRDYRTTSFL